MYINKKCDVIKILKKEYELLGWAIELKFLKPLHYLYKKNGETLFNKINLKPN